MNEIEVNPQRQTSLSLVTKADVDALKKQRELLREFVTSQLKEANFAEKNSPNYGEGDYGIIPGTKKRCLFKQGAEKIQRLFGLGCKFTMVDKEVDKVTNFAMYTYKCEVFSVNSGITIAECEASANSQEVKYKERTVWRSKKVNGSTIRESITEETPVFDILNTLQKMAQKRSLVGATLLATAASEYFTQDLLEPEDLASANKSVEPKAEAQGEVSQEVVPICCDQEMMISKYEDKDLGCKPWYCLKCRQKKAR